MARDKRTQVKMTEWQRMAITAAVEKTAMEPRSKQELLRVLAKAIEITATVVEA